MENSFKALVDQAKSILVIIPTKPFFDQVAASLGLYLSLTDQKDISVISPNPMTVEFNRLIGVNRISQDAGNKNLVIKFTNYEASGIERVSYDIENRQFQLTIIPKSGVKAPAKNQIDLSYTGFSSDLVILVGGLNDAHFPILAQKDVDKAKVVHIGVKDLTSQNSKIISLARPASSVSEIVAGYIKNSGYEISFDCATNLLMGIEAASNIYASRETTADTLTIASELMKMGGKRLAPTPQGMGQYPPGAIPGQYPIQPTQVMQANYDDLSNQIQAAQPQKIDSTNEPPLPEEPQEPVNEDVPDEWLQKPRVYKGTTL